MDKLSKLHLVLRKTGSAIVAYSGGVDSTFLLNEAYKVLGDKVTAVTVKSEFIPESEINDAQSFTGEKGINHLIIRMDLLSENKIAENSLNRCYFCKKKILLQLKEISEKKHFDKILHGANIDDLNDYRPGMKAALEIGAEAPLIEAGFTKMDIRFFSKKHSLKTHNKPEMACLASRIPTGSVITAEKLKRIELSEEFLKKEGFIKLRVRCFDLNAEIELDPSEIYKITEEKTRIKTLKTLKEFGFKGIKLNLEGYVKGRMNNL